MWRRGGIRLSVWTEGQADAAAGQLFAGGIREQEEADAAGQVSGRDGAGCAVASAGGASCPALPERRTRSATGSFGADATDSLFAAVVRAGRPGNGRSAVRQPSAAGFCQD